MSNCPKGNGVQELKDWQIAEHINTYEKPSFCQLLVIADKQVTCATIAAAEQHQPWTIFSP